MPETNSFVTEDIITHNTQSIAMGIVHKMLTNEKYYVLVVTPFDAQAEEVYVKVKQILNNLKKATMSLCIVQRISKLSSDIKKWIKSKMFYCWV